MVVAVVAADRAAKEAPADPGTPMTAAGMGRHVLPWSLSAGETARLVGRWTPITTTEETGRPTGPRNSETAPAM